METEAITTLKTVTNKLTKRKKTDCRSAYNVGDLERTMQSLINKGDPERAQRLPPRLTVARILSFTNHRRCYGGVKRTDIHRRKTHYQAKLTVYGFHDDEEKEIQV